MGGWVGGCIVESLVSMRVSHLWRILVAVAGPDILLVASSSPNWGAPPDPPVPGYQRLHVLLWVLCPPCLGPHAVFPAPGLHPQIFQRGQDQNRYELAEGEAGSFVRLRVRHMRGTIWSEWSAAVGFGEVLGAWTVSPSLGAPATGWEH